MSILRRYPSSAGGTVHRCDVVVHLAAVSNDPAGSAYEDVMLDVNFRAGVVGASGGAGGSFVRVRVEL